MIFSRAANSAACRTHRRCARSARKGVMPVNNVPRSIVPHSILPSDKLPSQLEQSPFVPLSSARYYTITKFSTKFNECTSEYEQFT
jgi:hypothetical protein